MFASIYFRNYYSNVLTIVYEDQFREANLKNSNNDLLYRLAVSALTADKKSFRLSCLTAVRTLQKDSPDLAQKLAQALSNYDVGANPLRGMDLSPPPSDRESGMELAKVIAHPSQEVPVLNEQLSQKVERFIQEHLAGEELMKEGLMPPSSVLLHGDPGVGKTMIGEYFAWKSRRELIVLDLASSVSSLLGKTGQNLKRVLEYAKSKPTVLFLDEFDSIAKDRDDRTDLGELKRIVNVLLKELEDWPHYSLLVAATNYPKLLDKAIWRRFDLVLEIPLPSEVERKSLVEQSLSDVSSTWIARFVAKYTDGMNASDIKKMCMRIRRRHILEKTEIDRLCFEEVIVSSSSQGKKQRNEVLKTIRKDFPEITLEQLSSWSDLSPSTISYHMNKGSVNEPQA